MNSDPNLSIPIPFENNRLSVLPEWIDGNGHMNVAYYLKAFDEGFDAAYRWLGLDYDLIARRGYSTMTVDMHISYQRELFVNAPMRITTQLIDCDRKRAHWVQAMYHRDEGFLAATSEWLILFIDMTKRRVARMPDDMFTAMDRVKAAHAGLACPMVLGRSISITSRKQTPA